MARGNKTKDSSFSSPNRLAGETSTYLLQHAYNPVDWYPWGQEALSKAQAEDKPILLSIGYSACHWCHVMAHESFEDAETAVLMNSYFVNIKVDREERPDLDEIYMKAVQILTGHGGWPMTVFLTPSLKPFYGGTYFPPVDRHGLPSFKRLLSSIEQAWQQQRQQIEESSLDITQYLRSLDTITGPEVELNRALIENAVDCLIKVFDYSFGGFGNAPKFPHPTSLSLAMRCSQPQIEAKAGREAECLNIVVTTLEKMACGGIHDQIGGGFARYAVDRKWLIPHFEKMLYDNALLACNYLDGYLLTGRKYWLTVAQDCLDFVLRELTSPEGAFYSSLDADSEGQEGKFYVFSPEEIRQVLGEEDGQWINEIYGVSDEGNFEHGTSVLYLKDSPETLAKKHSMTIEAFYDKVNPLRKKLLQTREKRVRPGRDDKILTSWNSLMISAFVSGYKVLHDKKYLHAAYTATDYILNSLFVNGRLLRTGSTRQVKLAGFLDDYAYFVQALIDLASVDFNPLWLNKALELTDIMISQFEDDAGNYFYTSCEHEVLITRSKNFYDGSTPSATSVAVFNLLRLSALADNASFFVRAQTILKTHAPYFARIPDQFSNMLCALDFSLRPRKEIVLVADKKVPDWEDMLFAIHSVYAPNTVVILKDIARERDTTANLQLAAPLLDGQGALAGRPTVYICKNYACQSPLTEVAEVIKALKQDLS